MNTTPKKHVRFKAPLVAIIFSLFLAVIALKAAYLQVYQGSWLSGMAADQYERRLITSGKRGSILDRNHTEMAVSIQVTSIAAHPANVVDRQQTAADLAKALKSSRSAILRKLSPKKSFVWIKRQATPREVERVKNLKLEGIGFVPEYNRFYPNKALAAQVIGFTGVDGDGLEGIEYYYDGYLKGEERKFTFLRDALGQRFVSAKQKIGDNSGNNIVLTIDRNIQYITEKVLQDTVTEFSAKSAIAIVMVPRTGAILAMAHYPLFNPNNFGSFSSEHRRNRAITDPIEPGSTMKIFSAAAAIDSGGSSPNTIFYCENGAYRIGNKVVHDLRSYGWLSLQQIIKFSSNIGAIKISEMVGPERLHYTLHNFGFGTKTGIDCPGETTGNLAEYESWSRLDTSVIAFGHGISVSPIQLITALSAIANRGILMKPYLVDAITDQNGAVVYSFKPRKIRRAISEETAKTVSNIMKTVITKGGTGIRAALDGYSVCGKTGTAKKINAEGTYAEGKYIASFVAYTPADRPEIAVLVIVDEPQDKYYGGIVAAPAFRRIAQETLNYLNIPPDDNNGQLAVMNPNEDSG